MAVDVAVLRARLIADTSQYQRSLATAQTQTQTFGSKVKQVGKIAGAALAVGMVAGAKKSIDAAADLEESVNKATATFEKSAPKILKWSKGTANALGLSRQAALEGASSIGAMLKPMGVAPGKAAMMSKAMTQLAADMASFNNEDPTEMLDRIRAGLSGESEPLKRYGAVLSETRVAQHAWKVGIAEAGAELTEQQKIMGRYSLLLRDTKDQQGDFARTSDSLANQQRILGANIDNLAASIGRVMIPVAKALTSALLNIGTTIRKVTGFVEDNKEQFIVLGTVMTAITAKWVAYKAAAKAAAAAQLLVNLAQKASPMMRIVAAITLLVTGLITAYKESKAFRQIVDAVSGALRTAIGWIVRAARDLGGALADAFGAVRDAGSSALSFFRSLPGKFTQAGKALALGLGRGLQSALNTALSVPFRFVNAIGDVIEEIPGLGGVGGKLKGLRAPQINVLAQGGRITRPTAIVGEEAPTHPEYVIATNPAYRKRNIGLLAEAGRDLGIPGFQVGGILGEAAGALGGLLPSLPGLNVAKGASHWIGKLPSVGDFFPPWMRGLGDEIRNAAVNLIRDSVTGIFGGGGGNGTSVLSQLGKGFNTLGIASLLSQRFGLSFTSGWRSVDYNRLVGGVEGSLHTHGTASRPGAFDMVGTMAAMSAASRYAQRFNPIENMIHDAGSGLHLHLGFFEQGGVLGTLRNKAVLNKNELATLAAKHGMANPSLMAAIAMAESSGRVGAIGDAGMSSGLWQIHRPSWPQFAASRLLDPNYNAQAAAHVLRTQGLGAWSTYNSGAYRSFLGGRVITGSGTGGTGGTSAPTQARTGKPNIDKMLKKAKVKPAPPRKKITGLLKKVKDLAFPKGMRNEIDNLTRLADIASEGASNASQLTLFGDDGSVTDGIFGGKSETQWLTEELGHRFNLRNTLVRAHRFLQAEMSQAKKLRDEVLKRLAQVREQLGKARRRLKAAQDHLGNLRKRPNAPRAAIGDAVRQVAQRTADVQSLEGERTLLTGKIIPKLDARLTGLAGDRQSMKFNLDAVQGMGGSMELMSALPPLGGIGGSIFQVQKRLADIASEKARRAAESSITDSGGGLGGGDIGGADTSAALEEQLRLLREQLAESVRMGTIQRIQRPVFESFFGKLPSFAGGGTVPGPPGMPVPILAHGGEEVYDPSSGRGVNVTIVVSDPAINPDAFGVMVDGHMAEKVRFARSGAAAGRRYR